MRVLLHHHTSVVCRKLVERTDSYRLDKTLISDGKSFVFVHKNKRKGSQSQQLCELCSLLKQL